MNRDNSIIFYGYDHFIVDDSHSLELEIPQKIRIADLSRMIDVNLNRMTIDSDDGRKTFELHRASLLLAHATAEVFFYVSIHALNGRRKVGTVKRWITEFELFLRTVKAHIDRPIGTITLSMFIWYSQQKNASQQKLLRSFLQYWRKLQAPGMASDLVNYLQISKPPKPRSTIEIQHTTAKERPFSIEQVRRILTDVNDLFINDVFNPQDNLLWRLIVSEAMRPGQMELLQVGDINFKFDSSGKMTRAVLSVPIVKQRITPARDYMMDYQLSSAVAIAFHEHITYLERLIGHAPDSTHPVFCVVRLPGKTKVQKQSIKITEAVVRTRKNITAANDLLEEQDLFTRRFKHTKLTHLAMLGAPLDVIARAGFHTTPRSLKRYVNLTEEAFSEYERLLSDTHDEIYGAFKGRVTTPDETTNTGRHFEILDVKMSETIGSCSTNPCNVLAPIGCYVCPRFEAFVDGPHHLVLDYLLDRKKHLLRLNLEGESSTRDDHLISAVQTVIKTISDQKKGGEL